MSNFFDLEFIVRTARFSSLSGLKETLIGLEQHFGRAGIAQNSR
jgi:hypothetical protein